MGESPITSSPVGLIAVAGISGIGTHLPPLGRSTNAQDCLTADLRGGPWRLPDRPVLVTDATVSRLQGVAKVAVTGALHDRLRAGELDASAETLGHAKICTAYQQ